MVGNRECNTKRRFKTQLYIELGCHPMSTYNRNLRVWEVNGKHFCTLRNSLFHQLYTYIIYICIVWYCYGALLRTSPMNTYVKVSFRLWSCKFGGLKLVGSLRKKRLVAPRFILFMFWADHYMVSHIFSAVNCSFLMVKINLKVSSFTCTIFYLCKCKWGGILPTNFE